MAPQNSTFPHENFVRIPLPAFEPLLQPSNCGRRGNDNAHEAAKSISNESSSIQETGEMEEIPIWICGAPRFVSGITSKTTCNDIIQVLIEDEIQYIDEIHGSQSLSRDICDYVITEKWRDIEQALPGETLILHIWNEWGVAQNEVKFKLKINKMKAMLPFNASKRDTIKIKSDKGKKINSISKLIRNVIRQGEAIHNQLSNFRLNSSTSRTPFSQLRSNRTSKVERLTETLPNEETERLNLYQKSNPQTDDEILLILTPHQEDKDSGINIHPGLPREQLAQPGYHLNLDTSIDSTIRFSYGKLDKLSKHEFVCSTPHSVNRRRKSLQFNIIRNEIVEATQQIDDLLQREKYLAKHLSQQRDKYRAQNEIYKTKAGLDVCVEEIQENLAIYGKEIVLRELDLYRIKNGIRHKCSVLNNLKRMLQGKDAAKYQSFRYTSGIRRSSSRKNKSQISNIHFVDNVYEFCDKNESILV